LRSLQQPSIRLYQRLAAMSPIETSSRIFLMRVNLPLLYEQRRAGIRNEVDALARRLKPLMLMRPGNMRETRFNGLLEGDKKQ